MINMLGVQKRPFFSSPPPQAENRRFCICRPTGAAGAGTVIASDAPGASFIITEVRYGLLTEMELCRAVRSCLEDGKDLTLIPYGALGKKVHRILREEFHTEPKWIADNYAADAEKGIYTLDALPEEAGSSRFLLCSEWEAVRVNLSCNLRRRFPEADILRIQDRAPSLLASYSRPDKVHLDFLGIGFPKCLTSSAYYALRENPAIYLSPVKENFFLSWNIYEGAHEAMAKCFPPPEETAGRLVGDIETSYSFFPERVAAYYGPDQKLLFFLREPSAALYSWFKMEMREVWSSYALSLMEKYGRVCPDMFDEYAETRKWLYCYGASLERYLRYFDRSRIHIVISEEMARKPRPVMDALQAFLGLPEERRIPVDVLPRANEGSLVAAGREGARVRHRCLAGGTEGITFSAEGSGNSEDPTLTPYKEPMLPSTRARLEEFFRPEIRQIEEILGRSLQGLWY